MDLNLGSSISPHADKKNSPLFQFSANNFTQSSEFTAAYQSIYSMLSIGWILAVGKIVDLCRVLFNNICCTKLHAAYTSLTHKERKVYVERSNSAPVCKQGMTKTTFVL